MTMWLSFQVSNLVNRHHLLWRLWSVPFKQGKSNEGKKVVTVSVEIEVSSNTGNSRCFRYEAQMQTRTTTRVDAIELAENGSKCPFFHLLVVLSSSPPPSCASKRTRQQDRTQPCAVTVSGAQFSHDPLDVCPYVRVCVCACGSLWMSPHVASPLLLVITSDLKCSKQTRIRELSVQLTSLRKVRRMQKAARQRDGVSVFARISEWPSVKRNGAVHLKYWFFRVLDWH